jgi:hypothetical protein
MKTVKGEIANEGCPGRSYDLSTPVEISPFRRSKTPPPHWDEGLHFQPIGVKMRPAGEAEAGSGGDQPAEE